MSPHVTITILLPLLAGGFLNLMLKIAETAEGRSNRGWREWSCGGVGVSLVPLEPCKPKVSKGTIHHRQKQTPPWFEPGLAVSCEGFGKSLPI